jgi:hypothetical protein
MANRNYFKEVGLEDFFARTYPGSIDKDASLIVIRISDGGVALYELIVVISDLDKVLIEGRVHNLIKTEESIQFTQEFIAAATMEGSCE